MGGALEDEDSDSMGGALEDEDSDSMGGALEDEENKDPAKAHPAEVNPAPGSIKVSSDVDSLSSSDVDSLSSSVVPDLSSSVVDRQLYTLRCQQCWVVVPKGQSCPDHPDAPLIDRTFNSYSDMFPAKVHESRFGGGGWSVVIFFLEILGLLL